jgi:hypothetical protein
VKKPKNPFFAFGYRYTRDLIRSNTRKMMKPVGYTLQKVAGSRTVRLKESSCVSDSRSMICFFCCA